MAKILLVDDSKIQRKWVKEKLGAETHEFIEGSNGLEALDLMAEHHPDMIVCDLNMPTMGGIECVETMQTRGLNFPVIIVTADIQDTTKEKCLKLGVRGIVNKPIKDDRLTDLVQEVLAEK